MKEVVFLLIGAVVGFGFSIIQERLNRLRAFRSEMQIVLAKVKTMASHEASKIHAEMRDRVLEECARIREDIPIANRKRFDSATVAFYGAENQQWIEIVEKRLFPRSEEFQLIGALEEQLEQCAVILIDCAKLNPGQLFAVSDE